MAPTSRPTRTGSTLPDTDRVNNTWTLITNRTKSPKAIKQAESSTIDECSGEPYIPSKELATFHLPDREASAANRWASRGHAPFKSFSWHQDHATSPNRDRRGLIGHPDVLYKDYRKKRKRGLPMSDDEETSSSQSDLESLDTESDSTRCSDSGDDHETEHSEDSATAQSQQYPFLRKDLVEFIYTLFVIWMASIRYIIPPDHRLKRRPKKRARMLIEETDPTDPSTVLISPFNGYYHLACPFYLSDPNQHKSCVMKHSLRSIEDLVAHIEKSHAEPPLCKICGRVFESFKDRNDHLRDETCEQQPEKQSQILHGVSQLQRVKILKRDNPRRAEEDRWGRIYKIIFEAETDATVSPYLTDGEGLRFSLLNDYWRLKGKECVREYLADHGHGGHGECQGDEFARLCSLVLMDLKEKVLEEGMGSDS